MSFVKVTVKEVDTGKVVKEIGVMGEHKADRVERGLLINMDTENFYVDQEPCDEKGELLDEA